MIPPISHDASKYDPYGTGNSARGNSLVRLNGDFVGLDLSTGRRLAIRHFDFFSSVLIRSRAHGTKHLQNAGSEPSCPLGPSGLKTGGEHVRADGEEVFYLLETIW
jgi:hypothetical protein